MSAKRIAENVLILIANSMKNIIKQIRYYYYKEHKGVMEIGRMLNMSRYKVAFWLGKLKRKPKTNRMHNRGGALQYELKRFNYIIKTVSPDEIEDPKEYAKHLRYKFIKQFGVKPEEVIH